MHINNAAEPEMSPCFIPFQNLAPPLPTMLLMSSITGGSLSDYMQVPLETQKALYNFFFFFFLTYVVLPKICKHTLMCKIGGVTL